MARILKASLFDPLNDRELTELLATIWEDDTLIRDHVDHNRVNIDYYSWDNAARRYLDFIESKIQP
jgi:glycosyltransferase involved in cell wall biosynthesis